MKDKFSTKQYRWVLAACIVAGVVLVGNFPVLVGAAPPTWAAADYYAPLFSLVADHAKAGRLLEWNPWTNGGTPDFADPQTGATSPVLMLFAVVSGNPFHGFIGYWMTIWIFGGIGMLLLCRHLRCPPWGSLIVALGFVTCGFYTGHAEHTSIINSFTYLPWILWRFDAAIIRRSYWSMFQVGVLWGLSALGGYPALTILDAMFLALWGAGRIWINGAEPTFRLAETRKRLVVFCLAGFCLLGAAGTSVMGPSYIGFFKFTRGYTFRTNGLDRNRVLTEEVLPPQALGTVASPSLYLLNWPPKGIWPKSDISMSNIYMGSLVVLLAAIALAKGGRWRFWLLFVIVFFFACSVGDHLPIRGWLYDLVPPTRFFRNSSLFSAYGILTCCVLAALGARDINEVQIARQSNERRRFALVAAATALAAGISYHLILGTSGDVRFTPLKATAALCLLWGTPVVILLLWWTKDVTDRLMLATLLLIALIDAGTTLYVSRWTIYSVTYKQYWNLMSSKHVANLDLTPNGLQRLLFPPEDLGSYQVDIRNVVTKQADFGSDTGFTNQFYQPYVNDNILNQLAVGSQRVWFSDHPVWVSPNDATFADYVNISHRLGVPPLLLHTTAQMMRSTDLELSRSATNREDWTQSARPVSVATVDVLEYHPNTLSIRYTADRDGWLLVTDRWSPDWRAEVNGQPVQIVGADFLFRAVWVSRGDNIVRFHYVPRGYLALVLLSWSVVLVFVGGEIYHQFLLKRPNIGSPIGSAA